MPKLTKKAQQDAKKGFSDGLHAFVEKMCEHVSIKGGDWTVKGFIDIYKNIYTISSDTKIVSKILEIHLFPQILQFAQEQGYSIVLAEHQNWYPDLSFVNLADAKDIDETEIIRVKELDGKTDQPERIGQREVTTVDSLRSIASVIKDFQFFVCEKWQLASDRQGSGNTANIGSITAIDDVLKGDGIFARLGEEWFDEYWMNYGVTSMRKGRKTIIINRLEDFVTFKKGDKMKIVPVASKRKRKIG